MKSISIQRRLVTANIFYNLLALRYIELPLYHVPRFKASVMNIIFDIFKAFCTLEWRNTKFRWLLRKQNNLDQRAGMAQRWKRSPSIVARFDSGPMSYLGWVFLLVPASHRGSFSRFSGFPLSSKSTRTEDPPHENQLRLIQCGFRSKHCNLSAVLLPWHSSFNWDTE